MFLRLIAGFVPPAYSHRRGPGIPAEPQPIAATRVEPKDDWAARRTGVFVLPGGSSYYREQAAGPGACGEPTDAETPARRLDVGPGLRCYGAGRAIAPAV